jgi:hypothetical protein
MIRSTVALILKHIYHKEVSIALQFPAWEGPVFMSQYLAVCEGTVGLIALNCQLWMAAGLALFLAIPIMWIAFCYTVLRRHVTKDRVRYIRFKPLTRDRIRTRLSMGKGCLGKLVACYLLLLQFTQRGEWQYEPDGNSALWSFLMQEYVGDFWFYALTRLFKKVAMSAVLSLTDGEMSAILAIILQSCDTICILSTRPHISRDVDITECVAAIFNTMAITLLGIPILAPSLAPYSSDLVALCLSVVSVLISLTPVLPGVAQDVLKSLKTVSSVANGAILALFFFVGKKSEQELRERMEQKYMRDVDLEQTSVRLQMMVESPGSMLTRPWKSEPRSFVTKIFRKLGIESAHYQCSFVYLRQAIAFSAEADVSIMYCNGPSISAFEQQSEDRALDSCMQPTHSVNSNILDYLLVSKFHAQYPKRLDNVVSYHHADSYDDDSAEVKY